MSKRDFTKNHNHWIKKDGNNEFNVQSVSEPFAQFLEGYGISGTGSYSVNKKQRWQLCECLLKHAQQMDQDAAEGKNPSTNGSKKHPIQLFAKSAYFTKKAIAIDNQATNVNETSVVQAPEESVAKKLGADQNAKSRDKPPRKHTKFVNLHGHYRALCKAAMAAAEKGDTGTHVEPTVITMEPKTTYQKPRNVRFCCSYCMGNLRVYHRPLPGSTKKDLQEQADETKEIDKVEKQARKEAKNVIKQMKRNNHHVGGFGDFDEYDSNDDEMLYDTSSGSSAFVAKQWNDNEETTNMFSPYLFAIDLNQAFTPDELVNGTKDRRLSLISVDTEPMEIPETKEVSDSEDEDGELIIVSVADYADMALP